MIPFLEFPCISFHSSFFSLTTFTELFSRIMKWLEHFSALSNCLYACIMFFLLFPISFACVLSYLEWENIFPNFCVVLNSVSCLSSQVAGWNRIKGTAIVPLMSSRLFWPYFILFYMKLISQQNCSCTSSAVKRSIFQLWFILFISNEANFTAILWNPDACSGVAELNSSHIHTIQNEIYSSKMSGKLLHC